MGAHTAKSNLVRPPAAHRCRKRRGGRAGWLGVRFVPSPRPSLRGKGARGHESAAAGRGLLPSYRRLLQVRPLPPRQSDALGIQGGVSCLPYPSPPHRRRRGWWTGRREGCGVWGWVVGAGARRAGRPGSRRGRKAPGRLPGRLLLWPPPPPCLTSCRRCGKMLHEGSHRRRSLRRPSSMVRQKPGRFRNDRALLYLGHHPRDFRRIKCA